MDTADEYESAAGYLAARGLTGKLGDPLPMGLSVDCLDAINCNPEDFQRRVCDYAYALAMSKEKQEEE